MESANPSGYKKLKVVYKDVGFFHGYYIQRGYRLFHIPNWLGKIWSRMKP